MSFFLFFIQTTDFQQGSNPKPEMTKQLFPCWIILSRNLVAEAKPRFRHAIDLHLDRVTGKFFRSTCVFIIRKHSVLSPLKVPECVVSVVSSKHPPWQAGWWSYTDDVSARLRKGKALFIHLAVLFISSYFLMVTGCSYVLLQERRSGREW